MLGPEPRSGRKTPGGQGLPPSHLDRGQSRSRVMGNFLGEIGCSKGRWLFAGTRESQSFSDSGSEPLPDSGLMPGPYTAGCYEDLLVIVTWRYHVD